MKKTAKTSKTIRENKTQGQSEGETPAAASAGGRLKPRLKDAAGLSRKSGWGRPHANQAGRALCWRLLRSP